MRGWKVLRTGHTQTLNAKTGELGAQQIFFYIILLLFFQHFAIYKAKNKNKKEMKRIKCAHNGKKKQFCS